MNPNELKKRTKRFALNIILLVENLPKTRITEVIGRQLLRSGISVGANYRSACSARSIAEFIAKMGIVEEELDETLYWIELLIESGILLPNRAEEIIREAKELLAITVASIKTAKRKK